MKSLAIGELQQGKRFDAAAAEMLPSLSRMYVHALIEGRRILLNGEQQKGGYKLRVGDVITTDFDESEIEQIADIELPILYEDDDVLIVNKPEGIISHSRSKYWNEPSVASFVRQKCGREGERAGIVNRLDRATSGVMVCAKNQEALSFLHKQFSTRKVKKTYIALVHGEMTPPEGVIDLPLERNPIPPFRFQVSSTGKSAQTKYSVIKQQGSYRLLKLEPLTGRSHQLRVHLAAKNHPIVGDELYNGERAERLFLHALSLEIALPSGKRELFEAELPESFANSAAQFIEEVSAN